MNEMLEKIKNADSKVQLVVLAIVVLLVIIIGFSSFNDGDSQNNSVSLNDSSESGELSEDGESMEKESDTNTNAAAAVTGLAQFTRVKIAALAGPVHEGDISGKKRSCDTVVMIDRNIPMTPAPLNGAMKELFRFNGDLDFVPGNFIKTQSNLSFSEAKIDNGVAKVYLEGEVGPLAGDCDNDRVKIQVEETALQFNTVKSVEVYLNGNLI